MNALDAARNLRANYLTSAIGLDSAPRLTWEPSGHQEAYRIECARQHPDAEDAPYSAERTASASAHQLAQSLESKTRYRWRVQTRSHALWGQWSAWATFETALLDESDWCGAEWIGSAVAGPAPILSTNFSAGASSSMRLYLCGLGVANVSINGRPVGDGVLDPPPSAYDETIFYRAFDVSPLVDAGENSDGANSISVLLGRGYYAMMTQTSFNWHTAPWHSEPKLRALLIDLDNPGTPLLSTSETWRATQSPVLDDSLYAGELHDFGRAASVASAVGPAVVVEPPRGSLKSCLQPQVTRRERIDVVDHRWTGDDRQRFDLAKNVAGMVTVTTDDASAPTLLLKLGEKLGPDGEVVAEDGAIPGHLQRSQLIGMPADRPISLDLTYAGMRYAEVTGPHSRVSVEVDRVSAAPEPIGSFECSDGRLGAVHDTTRLTLENCLQAIPIDTPLYEKQGYTGDAQLLTETLAYNYWMPNYLSSWLEASVLPSQSPDGSIPGITPTPPGNWIFDTPSPAWDAALFELPETLLRHYGDRATVRRALPTLRRYLAYLERQFPSGIVTVGLGDWNPPGFTGTPPEHPAIVSTAYYYRFLTTMAGFTRRFGDDREAAGYTVRAQSVREAFQKSFWRNSGFYAEPSDDGYRETNNVLALEFDLVPAAQREGVLSHIIERIRTRGTHLDTGMVGTRFLLRTLTGANRADVAFDIARNETYPGWLHWINNGATTLYENWELDGRSHNHAMFGTIEEWFYADVAGIAPGSDGWGTLEVNPNFPADHRFGCRATLDTITGPVEAEWEKAGSAVRGRVIASKNVPVSLPEIAARSDATHRTAHRDAYTDEHTFTFSVS